MNYFKQAIVVKYLGPTNHRGARVKATCKRGSITIAWNYDQCPEQNAEAALKALVGRFIAEDMKQHPDEDVTRNPWRGPWAGGALPSGGWGFLSVVGLRTTRLDKVNGKWID